ncbi:T9SS type A sorting domain-containing protein [Flagellimonas sp. CMM7]|uniref:InlB B-repeat-containing protein n=1 Tax=Flagellimonas sp. CMM7 TaxID=2654676 RepID=UPI0013D791F8|nr:T9SS type A sorting domain-containing protein [Flagellimonas sp. CMM7]UII79871.1 T9SS type A sorting domain-containing protein [Flagellimonas sp. CMM7]
MKKNYFILSHWSKLSLLCSMILLVMLVPQNMEAQFGQGQTPAQVAGTPTVTAIANGNWTDASTWNTPNLPGTNARVRIPSQYTVTVNSVVTTEHKSINVEGTLRFATNVNTELRAEYVHSAMGSVIEIGTAASPIAPNVTASFVVADLGGGGSADWWRYAPGLVLMGKVDMHGEQKTTWMELNQGITAGATSMTLAQTPLNWKVGDKLVIAATTSQNFTSDDVVTIQTINGNNVTFTPATQYAHQPPSQAPNLKVHVANYTRNVKFTSANPSVTAKRRGHVMFMHNADVRMRYVEMNQMGRTDKTQPVNDFQGFVIGDINQVNRAFLPGDPGSPELLPSENVWGPNTNPRGRYSVHFHRSLENETATDVNSIPKAVVEGVTVFDDPGWGYVNHSSNVDFINNASYAVVGGAFNTEAGDELGSFVGNIALRTWNTSDPFGNPLAGEADLNLREGGMDFAFQGDAYWFHSHGVTIRNNIAAGVSGHSYVFWPEGLIELGKGQRRGNVNWHLSSAQRALVGAPSSHPEPDFNNIPWQFDCWLIPAKPFENNTAYSASKGVSLFYGHSRFLNNFEGPGEAIAAGVPAGTPGLFNHVPETFRQTLEIKIDGTKIWNIRNSGISSQYASHVTISNNEVYGYDTPPTLAGRPIEGIDLDHWRNSDNWLIEGNTIRGFTNGAIGLTPPTNATSVVVRNNIYDNPGTDIRISSRTYKGEADGLAEEGIGNPKAFPGWPGMVTMSNNQRVMTLTNENFISTSANNIVMRASLSNDFVVDAEDGFAVSGQPRNPYSFLYRDEITLNFGEFSNSRLYFNEQAGSYTPITNQNERWDAEEVEPGGTAEYVIPNAWRNKTNNQLLSVNLTYEGSTTQNHSFGGEIMPAGANTHPQITGGQATNIVVDPCAGVTPPAPTNVTATNNNCISVDLSWTASNCATSYRVQRRVDGGTWSTLNANLAATNYTDNSPASGDNEYRVRAQNSAGNSSDELVTGAVSCGIPTQYTLTTNTNGSGSISLNPSGGTYNDGTVVTATATPASGYQFDNWSGSSTSTSSSVDITMDANKSLTANFSLIPPPAGLTAESGSISGISTSGYTAVSLTKSFTNPVVVATPVLPSTGTASVVTRVRNVTGNSFEVKVQNPSGSAVSGIEVKYLIVEAGTYTLASDGVKMEAKTVTSSVTARKNGWTLETETYNQSYTSPVVLGQIMTANDANWSVFYATSSSRTSPPSASALRAGKHVGEDSNTSRANETVGLIIVEAGSGIVDDISFQAGVGSDIVRGPGNSASGYSYSHSVSDATGAILSASGMDGGDGGFPVLLGASSISGSNIAMTFDEDQIGDSERNHTTEQVAYMVFNGGSTPPVQYTLTTSTDGNGSVTAGGTYNAGTVVQISPTPNAGYVFSNWSGDASGASVPLSVTMDANKNIVANFTQSPPTQYILTTNTNGSGSISLNPSGGTYNDGTVVTATATPASGYQFDNWSGASTSTSSSVDITMDANKSLTANFSQVQTYQWNMVDNADASISYNGSWASFTGISGCVAGTHNESSSSGASASLTFTGTQVRIYIFGESGDGGNANVLIDGNQVGTIDFTAFSGCNQLAFTSATLSAGSHTVQIQRTSGFVFLDGIEFFGPGGGSSSSKASKSKDVVLNDNDNNKVIISMYPNPVEDDYVNIGFIRGIEGNNAKLNIYDMAGRQLVSEAINNIQNNKTHQVDISNLQSGNYLLIVKHSRGTKSFQMIKK